MARGLQCSLGMTNTTMTRTEYLAYNRINVLVSCTCFPVEDRRPGYGAAQQRAGSATAVRFNVPVKVKS